MGSDYNWVSVCQCSFFLFLESTSDSFTYIFVGVILVTGGHRVVKFCSLTEVCFVQPMTQYKPQNPRWPTLSCSRFLCCLNHELPSEYFGNCTHIFSWFQTIVALARYLLGFRKQLSTARCTWCLATPMPEKSLEIQHSPPQSLVLCSSDFLSPCS